MYCVIKIIVFFNPLCVLMTCRKELITSTVIYGLYVEERESVPQMWTVCTREGISSTDVDCGVQERESLPQMWTVCTRKGITSTDVGCVHKTGNQFH